MQLGQPHISFQEKLLLTKHLSVLVKSGVPISDALQILVQQSAEKNVKRVLTLMQQDIANGQPLSHTMEKFPRIFNGFYINMVRIGEDSGTLEQSFSYLTKQLGDDYALHKKVQGALLYPSLILLATTIMGGFISLFVLPQLVDFFDAFDTTPPLATRILLAVAQYMKVYGAITVTGTVLALIVASFVVRTKHIKPYWHALLLRLPLFGKLLTYNQLSRSTRNLGILLRSGIAINSALATTAETVDNIPFQHAFTEVAQTVKSGQELSAALQKASSRIFPPLVVNMVAVGEHTGSLEDILIYISDFYEEEIDAVSKNLSTILEPVLLLGIGLVVGFVAIAIISPIYELTGSIR